MDTLARLAEWYSAHCDGDWEHDSGFSLHPVDNPGWVIEQKLSAIGLSMADQASRDDRTETDWIHVVIRDQLVIVAGGVRNLQEIIDRFLNLVAPHLR